MGKWTATAMTPLLTLSALVINFAATEPEDAANAAAGDYCTMHVYTEQIQDTLISWLTSAADATQKPAQQERLFALAAAKNAATQDGLAYTVLHQIVANRLTQQAANQHKAEKAISTALRTFARKAGESAVLAAAIEQAEVKTRTHDEQSTAGQIFTHTSGTNTKVCKAKQTSPVASTKKCADTNNKDETVRGIGTALRTAKKVNLYSSREIQGPTMEILFEALGDLSAGDNWGAAQPKTHCERHTGSKNAATGNIKGIAIQKMKISSNLKPKTITLSEATTGNGQGNSDGKPGEQHLLTDDKEIATALLAAQAAVTDNLQPLGSEAISAIATMPEAQAFHKSTTKLGQATAQASATAENIAKVLFGKTEGTVEANVVAPLKSDSNSIPTGETPITGSSDSIARGAKIDEALAYYYVKNLQKATQTIGGTKNKENGKAD
ncbi:variant surface glycoprotein (VSG, atypical), putative [Trypanosoma equiperdum]|uniref:Variant surface glycoprotein (VSG, atypical), putative n=1 Tax=Trypanosoma equiperdum TaxID=5694 RepID=A0A1G4IB93_TRYEQ|nr:variant surface glycoprotein (VSG, atypical), putative [Trypanosoma equiperdum]